ncbi:MAG: CoA-binding protein [Bryobacteraceae bacterium]|nr:CoA-binding protein [Bryobacteraceae bacterium]
MRPSFGVARYMQKQGYRIVPVNPAEASILGETSYATLADIPFPVDCVNVFRRPEFVPEIVEDAIRIGAKSVWMQEEVVHEEAAARARAAGLDVVMDKCLLKEHRGLGFPPAAVLALCLLLAFSSAASAADWPSMKAWRGSTPKLDGTIGAQEYADATHFTGVKHWAHTFHPTTDDRDLSLEGWVKHDGNALYFAFRVTDDVLYGVDTPRWLSNNPRAHELTREGFPWFGDEMELLLNATNKFVGNESVAGNGQSWQMVCNVTKSRLGGVGKGGLLEGEPRRELSAWNTYQSWIQSGAQRCAVQRTPQGYVLEWSIQFKPCVEVAPGEFYSVKMGDKAVGLNIALGDLDQKERGAGNPYFFHHEDWWSGGPKTRTQLNNFGTLWLMAGKRPAAR